mmetsp:Transcript_26935/g.58618  ORF Transcript_26935/g.58618 Transcript_26935/m.58618 type:complete len:232 (-) Transcript_26935:89-784(-)
MLPERLKDYLTSKGLSAADVPKIGAAWVAMKYATKGTLLIVGVRYQPLSRAFSRAYQPLRERARGRLAHELERVKDHETTYGRQLRKFQMRKESLENWRHAWRGHMRRRMDHMRRTEGNGLYQRVATWYRTQAAKKSEIVARSRFFSAIARMFSMEPKKFAVGAAEGLIMGVMFAPIYYPVYFYMAVRFYQLKGENSAEDEPMKEIAELGWHQDDLEELENDWREGKQAAQ